MSAMHASTRQSLKNILVLLLVIPAGAGLLLSGLYYDATHESSVRADDENVAVQERRHAAQECGALIKKRVRTPSTVKFKSPLMGDYYVDFRPPEFPVNTRIIKMEFDAQNVYGAVLHHEGECNFKVTAGGWEVNYVSIDGN